MLQPLCHVTYCSKLTLSRDLSGGAGGCWKKGSQLELLLITYPVQRNTGSNPWSFKGEIKHNIAVNKTYCRIYSISQCHFDIAERLDYFQIAKILEVKHSKNGFDCLGNHFDILFFAKTRRLSGVLVLF